MECASLNTTECLLLAATRATQILAEIEKSTNEINWDPQTFAVTLIIGIIALFFAALTIVQGLIAAAPGKHCSKYALGPWSHYSKRHIDWSEMRMQATAYTPIVHMTAVYRYLRQVEDVKWQHRKTREKGSSRSDDDDLAVTTECRKVLGKRSRHLFPPSKKLDEYFPATWLALLTSVDLDNPGLWTLKPTRTDYIPSDLVAAPAYATIMDMVVLCAISAFPRHPILLYQKNSVLSGLQGPDFNLELRQHPTIGFHGVYQTFDLKGLNAKYGGEITSHGQDRGPLLLPPSEVSLVLVLNAYGHVPQLRELDYDKSGDFLQLYTLTGGGGRGYFADWPYDRERLRRSWRSSTCTDTSSTKCLDPNALYPCWCKYGGYSFIEVIGNSLDDGRLCRESPWSLLMAKGPDVTPTIFPRRVVDMQAKLQLLLVLSRFWSLDQDVLEQSYLAGGFAMFPHEGYNDDTTDRTPPRPPSFFGKTFVPTAKAIEECRRYLKAVDKGWGLGMQDSWAVYDELSNIERYLRSICPDLLFCRRICLGLSAMVCSSMVEMKLTNDPLSPCFRGPEDGSAARERTIPLSFSSNTSRRRVTDLCNALETIISWYREDPFGIDDEGVPKGRRFPGFSLWDPENADAKPLTADQYSGIADELEKVLKIWEVDGNGDFVYDRTEVQQHVDDLLIYRCILIALSYTNTIDNSEFLEDPAYTKYIPLL